MAQQNSGNYRPSGLSMSKAELVKGLKGIKVRAPNRKISTASYKSGLPKMYESGGNA